MENPVKLQDFVQRKIKEADFQILLNTNPKVTKKLLENIAKINLE